MSLYAWDPKYLTGHPEVDRQHKELFRMVNELHQAMIERRGKETLLRTLDELAKYVVTHFSVEEKMMVSKQYPGYAAHKTIHDKLTKDATEIIDSYKSGKNILTITLASFLSDWIKHHIEGEDIKMIKFVQSK